MGNDITEEKLWNSKQMWKALTATAVGVFFVTMIYYEFRDSQKQQLLDTEKFVELEALINDVEANTNERMDRKTARIEEDVKGNASEIEKLKQPNSDK